MENIEKPAYRQPLCPYLTVGNRRMLVHLDAYCVPQSLQWPRPGAPDRLAWRDPLDEWPYWEEMDQAGIRARMPYFEYENGVRDYLCDARSLAVDYIEDTNIIRGEYSLPGGARVELTTFVPPGMDVWVREFRVSGVGKLILQGEFFEKSVRGHASTHLGTVNFRGAMDAAPRGAYVLVATIPLAQHLGRVEVPVAGVKAWTIGLAMAEDMQAAATLGEQLLARGVDAIREATAAADRAWIAGARAPVSRHPLVGRHYKRWLLANILHVAADGAMSCGARPFWSFAWPRDCSMQAVAFAAAGYPDTARDIIGWHLSNTPASGVHEARYLTDRTPMLLDNRPRQGDNPGWLCWAAGAICRLDWNQDWVAAMAAPLHRLAGHLVLERDPETLLPLPEADFRETQIAESLGLALTAIGGLKGAAGIAGRLDDSARARRYLDRAAEIKRGVETHLWDTAQTSFVTSVKPLNPKDSIAICWGGYPFAVWEQDDRRLVAGVEHVYRTRWNQAAGGVLTMAGTPYASFWMYHAGILLLGAAALGNHAMEAEILAAIERNISPQGLIPEQFGQASGNIWGCAPLPVAHANMLLYAYKQSDDDIKH